MSDDEIQADDEEEAAPAEQPTVDAGSASNLRKRQTRAIVEREKVRRFWSSVLRDETGRKVVWQLLADLHTFEERFACGPSGFPQPEATWFHAGEQAVGLRLYKSLALYDREALFTMHDLYDPAFVKPKAPRKRRVE